MNNAFPSVPDATLRIRCFLGEHGIVLRKISLTVCLCLVFLALCATKCPNVTGGWNPTGNPIGGGPGYSNIVHNWDFHVSNKSGLLHALTTASSGNIIYVADTAEIDLTGEELLIPGGVTLASGRGRTIEDTISWGALLYTSDDADDKLRLFTTAGTGIRITGLRIRGPYHYRAGRETFSISVSNQSYGVFAWHDSLEVDNCEFWGWGHSALYYSNVAGHAHHNYIHEGQNYGQGLGIMIGHGGEAIVEANLFDYIRENIASVGDTNTSWEARYNIGLEHTAEHNFDRHGWPSNGQYGGKRTLIHHNISKNLGNRSQPEGKSIRIRGEPVQCCSIYNNWLYPRDRNAAIAFLGDSTNCFVFDNHYGTSPPAGLDSKLPYAAANANIDSGTVPLEVSFVSAGSFDPDGGIAWCEWDFGDNTPTIRKGASGYTFNEIGVYNVRLTVHDEDGLPDSDLLSIIAAPSDDSMYLSVWVNDRYHSGNSGYFAKQILIDDNVVWEDDVALCEGWKHVVKNVTNYVQGRDSVTITCRLICEENYGAGNIAEIQTYWDDIALFWGDVRNGNFETGLDQIADHWQYIENHQWFHGSWTSGDVRSGDCAYRIFFYTQNDCAAGRYGQISQKVAVGAMNIPQSDRQGRLFSVYPNPTLKTTVITYRTPVRNDVSMKMYDTNGRLVRTLIDSRQDPGFYQVDWDGSDDHGREVANGVYFCEFLASPVDGGEEHKETKKIVLLK
jgi:hypothetical protein